jgi:uncharacterized protein YggE
MSKHVVSVVLAATLLVAVGLGAFWAWGQIAAPAIAQTGESDRQPAALQTIIVVGQGSVRTTPDVASIGVGVDTASEKVDDAVAENAVTMQAVLDALKVAGVEDKDIRTTNYSIQIDRNPDPLATVGGTVAEEVKATYRVSNMVDVTVRDLESVGEVLDTVVKAGANNVWGVNFTLDDPQTAQATARADAVADAQVRAEALAELGGVTLGPVMSMSEVISGGSIPVPFAAELAKGAGGPISPGEVEIGYSLQVVYFIEP